MKAFFKGFVYAFNGVKYCLLHERNFRFHTALMVYMFGYLTIYDWFEVSRAEFAALIALCALVLALEAVNTAVERAVDLAAGRERSVLARIAKDAAAGAVLIAAVGAVAVGLVILLQPAAFRALFEYYKTHPLMLGVLALSLVPTLIFIFHGSKAQEARVPGGED